MSQREAYQIPTSGSQSANAGASGAASGAHSNAFDEMDMVNASGGTIHYLCGDCGTKFPMKKSDPIRCKECGCRVLYKERTKRYYCLFPSPGCILSTWGRLVKCFRHDTQDGPIRGPLDDVAEPTENPVANPYPIVYPVEMMPVEMPTELSEVEMSFEMQVEKSIDTNNDKPVVVLIERVDLPRGQRHWIEDEYELDDWEDEDESEEDSWEETENDEVEESYEVEQSYEEEESGEGNEGEEEFEEGWEGRGDEFVPVRHYVNIMPVIYE
ncbi:hypothetical protein K449DRAFT_425677 [Hypoxylon sp. EC38]|nr:hypothetical protein K449DRAFT_425677 [Hypoxylon sp. EC38]